MIRNKMAYKKINIFLILRHYRALTIESMSRRGYSDYGRYMKALMSGPPHNTRAKSSRSDTK